MPPRVDERRQRRQAMQIVVDGLMFRVKEGRDIYLWNQAQYEEAIQTALAFVRSGTDVQAQGADHGATP